MTHKNKFSPNSIIFKCTYNPSLYKSSRYGSSMDKSSSISSYLIWILKTHSSHPARITDPFSRYFRLFVEIKILLINSVSVVGNANNTNITIISISFNKFSRSAEPSLYLVHFHTYPQGQLSVSLRKPTSYLLYLTYKQWFFYLFSLMYGLYVWAYSIF